MYHPIISKDIGQRAAHRSGAKRASDSAAAATFESRHAGTVPIGEYRIAGYLPQI
jgi:hypothetical protein